MSTTTRGACSRAHLTLVESALRRPRLAPPRTALSLCGAPYRPGELPEPCPLALPEELRGSATESARAHGVPVELWLRAAIDASRAVDALAALGAPREEAIALLDRAADSPTSALSASNALLLEYERLLLAGEPASVTGVAADLIVELLVPLDLRGAWEHERASAGQPWEAWAATRVRRAPAHALRWEAAAAARGLRVVEWAYASSAERAARCSARPHART